ncbi:MAG: hypothetical protein EPN47_11205 [Acidobacteria bacterium]|nr:MAG: hypothetical protein EPN47_11205 [Acidobacteriota bacterium]
MALTLYKYVPSPYAGRFVSKGEVLFRALSYFLACEHDERGDNAEGIRIYEPEDGLEITKQTGERLRIQGSFRSSVKEPNKIFVFSTSLLLSGDLAQKFQADACVEIADVGTFVARLRTALRRRHRAKLKTLICGEVTYYRNENPPKEVWALPDRIVMHKAQRFASQREYRFVFSTKTDAYDFENVTLALVRGQQPRLKVGSYPAMLLKLGPMTDCCRIHRF